MFKQSLSILLLLCSSFVYAAGDVGMTLDDNGDTETVLDQRLDAILDTLSSKEKTALEKRMKTQQKAASNPYSLLLYKPTYILPFYYTTAPYYTLYAGQTPDNQKVMKSEFKFQLSVQIPVILHLFGKKNSLNIGYTQDSFWQVYAKSQYFRETNYEPEIFFRRIEDNTLAWQTGFVHQSNGRGGEFERSWNRAYLQANYSLNNWAVQANIWTLIFKSESSNLHNPNVRRFLGNGDSVFSYKFGDSTLSFSARNNLQSGFKRGAETLTFSFPVHGHFRGFIYAFSGYGQSLIEYNHYTNAIAIGIDINDWI